MKRLLIAMVKFYRKNISPWRPPCCRYIPTCSQYALEALEKYGALKGSWLSAAIPSTREGMTRCREAAMVFLRHSFVVFP